MLILGLGNPGLRFHHTRHNVGFAVVEHMASGLGIRFRKPIFRPYRKAYSGSGNDKLILVEPLTFMNNSGDVVRYISDPHIKNPYDVVVVCDNLDLPAGACRLKKGGGHAGHNGLKSIIARTGTTDFLRLYIGIGRPGGAETVVDWVLGEPDFKDAEAIKAAVIRASEALLSLRHMPVERVMNELNQKR